ncbi:MAG: response regulator [Chloroflexi bacterium]|nr:response regulator [Chloroflexota bacterium]
MDNLASQAYLVVDDDPQTLQILSIILEKTIGSSQVALLENSQQFMQRVEALPYVPTVIFLDIFVRPYNGYEMLSQLRQSPTYRDAKIIAVTGRVMGDEVDRIKNASFDGMISKPLHRHVFPDLVQKILCGEEVWYIA